MNSVQDYPVTIEDIKLAEAIYGPDVPSLKGKITHGHPSPVVEDIVEIPAELVLTILKNKIIQFKKSQT